MTLVSRFLCFFECQSLVFDSFRRVCGAGVRNRARFGNETMRLFLVESEMNNVIKSKKRAQEVQLTRDEKRFKLFPEVELFPVVGITELVGRAQLYHHVRGTKLLREPELHVLPLEGMRKLLREAQLTLHVRRKKLFREAELFADVASVESFQEVNSMAFEGGAVKLEQKGPAKLHVIGGPFMCKRSVGLFLYRGTKETFV